MSTHVSKPLKPLRLHELIGQQAAWTDALWNETLKYLLEHVGTDDAISMSFALTGATGRYGNALYKIDYLREFRDHPPTLLLGIFDLVREQRQSQKK